MQVYKMTSTPEYIYLKYTPAKSANTILKSHLNHKI